MGRDQQESADPKEEAQPEKHRSTKNQHGKEEDTNLAYEWMEILRGMIWRKNHVKNVDTCLEAPRKDVFGPGNSH